MIFFFFKPLNIKEEKFVDIPLFEIKSFSLYELNAKGMKTFMSGESALRYSDRYKVKEVDFTDNSKNYIANMKANNCLYKANMVYLDGNVSYARNDGLVFESQHVIYDKKTSIVTSNSEYIAYMGENTMIGNFIKYNTRLNKVKSKNVVVRYKLKDGEL